MTTYHNDTTGFQIVANCETVLSSHGSLWDAMSALDAIPYICETQWSTISVVAPGQTVSADLVAPESQDDVVASADPFGVMS